MIDENTLVLSSEYIGKCLKAVNFGAKDSRGFNYVVIEDDADGIRHYVGFCGELLAHITEEASFVKGMRLSKPLLLRPVSFKSDKFKLNFHMKEGETMLVSDSSQVFEDVSGQRTLPEWREVIPDKDTPHMNFPTMFSWKILKTVGEILGRGGTFVPRQENNKSPAVIRWGEYEVVFMPLAFDRLERSI